MHVNLTLHVWPLVGSSFGAQLARTKMYCEPKIDMWAGSKSARGRIWPAGLEFDTCDVREEKVGGAVRRGETA